MIFNKHLEDIIAGNFHDETSALFVHFNKKRFRSKN